MTYSSFHGAGADRVHDLVGIGFGPANLALAVALEEEAERPGGTDFDGLFLEARTGPCWHPGMLLEGSLIQITVLKDLITVRNPRSRFTFLNYLKEKDRLFEFLNLRDLFPTRIEFNDYLCWVADQLEDRVRYGRRVLAVEPVEAVDTGGEDGRIALLRVRCATADGGEESHLARNVAVATGGRPWLPDGIEIPKEGPIADRVFHAYDYVQRIGRGFPEREGRQRMVVVGSGQSGAELFNDLLERYPRADVTAAVRRYGYKPVDESDFTNEVFFPGMIDFFYDLPETKRREVVDSFRDVNYAVVDQSLIQKIYRRLYDERVAGKDRARLRPYLALEELDVAEGEPVRLRFRHLIREAPVEIECDGAIIATGFRWDKEHPLLEGLRQWFETDADGGYSVLRDYRLASRDGFAPRVYLQGYCEATHGISETVLSLLPMRAGDIVESLIEARREQSPAAAGAPGVVAAGVEP